MKAMTDVLSLIVAAIAGITAIYFYYLFATARTRVGERLVYDMQGTGGSSYYLYYAIAATIIACVAIVFYFLRHVNKEEEIHITQ